MSDAPRSTRHRLALAGAALALTAAAIGLFSPLRDFYTDMVMRAAAAGRRESLASTAAEMIEQQRLEEAESLLDEALALEPRDHGLLVQRFFVSTWLQLADASDFDETYQGGKHVELLPLIVEGYRLASLGDDDAEHAAILAHLGLLHFFDPLGVSASEIESVLREAIDLDADEALAWMCLGFLQAREGEADAAVEAWRATVRIDPEAGLAWAALGRHHEARGERRAALEAWRRAYASERPSLGVRWAHRMRDMASDHVAAILRDDLYGRRSGESLLDLAPQERLAVIDEVQAGARHLLARAKSAAGQPAEAAALLWQQLESAPPRYWGAEELRALGMLFEIAPDVEDGALRRGDLLEAWDLVSRARSGVAVPLPDGVGPLWVTSTRPSVLRLGPRSALARAGLRVGDRVLGISGTPVETPRDMADRLGDLEGAPVALLVERGIEPIVLPLTPEEG